MIFSNLGNTLRKANTQITILGLICFSCPGIFNALNSLGGAGLLDTSVASKANAWLYAMFAFGSLFLAAPIFNVVQDPRLLIIFGGLTYPLYVLSILLYLHGFSEDLVIITGATLGFGASLLWTAQGSMLLSYSTPCNRGIMISHFWSIFNMGGIIGGLLTFLTNFNSQTSYISDSTYFYFVIIMISGIFITKLLQSPSRIEKEDMKDVQIDIPLNWASELLETFKLFLDYRLLLLIPTFLCSNFFYTYQFNAFNAFYFNARTKGFNNMFYWGFQSIGSAFFGRYLDRKNNGKHSYLLIVTLFNVAWFCGYVFQSNVDRFDPNPEIDFLDKSFIPLHILYIYFGLCDSLYQNWIYWFLGEFSENSNILSRNVGFYKGIQSIGAAASWMIDGLGYSYMFQLFSNWTLFVVSIPFTLIIIEKVRDMDRPKISKI